LFKIDDHNGCGAGYDFKVPSVQSMRMEVKGGARIPTDLTTVSIEKMGPALHLGQVGCIYRYGIRGMEFPAPVIAREVENRLQVSEPAPWRA
jgi:hypothetical protein